MRTTQTDLLQQALADLHRAQKELAQARRHLADCVGIDVAPVLIDPQYKAAYDAARAQDAPWRSIPGVVGVTLGRVLQRGLPTGELCVTVLVEQKLTAEELQARNIAMLPASVNAMQQTLRVDVVPVGKYTPHVMVGTSLGPAPNASGSTSEGTIGAFATDMATQKLVAITAMHVVGAMQNYPDGSAAPELVTPSPMLQQPTTHLGKLLAGTRNGIDAAKIAVDVPGDASSIIPGIGEVAGWRPVAFPGDENACVRLAGALSGVTHGAIIHIDTAIPEAGIDSAILADIPSQPGDSGAPLLDEQNNILGFLAGALTGGVYANLRVFSPVATVLSVLQCEI